MIPAAALIEEARAWVGVPYRHQGRSKSGVDCAGFLVALVQSVGQLPRGYDEPSDYGRFASDELIRMVRTYCTQARRPAPGSLLLLRWPRQTLPSHCALYTGETMIHAHSRAGFVVEHGYRGAWLSQTHSVWRLPGVLYE